MLTRAALADALARQPLFDGKSWRLSPRPWHLAAAEHEQLRLIGAACVEYHVALEKLYLRAAAGKNLLRNRPLEAPWVAEYLDRGKPESLVRHGRHPRLRGRLPTVLRPDLLVTAEGFALTELDSVPGGIGLTAFLNRLYQNSGCAGVVGADDAMLEGFYRSLAALVPQRQAPLVAIVVSDEAATYRPEMEWVAEELQRRGRRVYCLHPGRLFPLGNTVCIDIDGNPERVDVVYRFFELFDLAAIPAAAFLLDAWEAGEVEIAPPLRAFQEEKLGLALLHHHRLEEFWRENLSPTAHDLLRHLVPRSWVVDPAPVPPQGVLVAPPVGGRPPTDWRQLGQASQRERDLVLKISGFHETAWGARSVVVGNDVSREDWQRSLEHALEMGASHLHVLQEYRKPARRRHTLFGAGDEAAEEDGRVRLCPYYFVRDGAAELCGALATFCPPDKKIIHGMQDAALLPSALGPDAA